MFLSASNLEKPSYFIALTNAEKRTPLRVSNNSLSNRKSNSILWYKVTQNGRPAVAEAERRRPTSRLAVKGFDLECRGGVILINFTPLAISSVMICAKILPPVHYFNSEKPEYSI
jgi:hypothetical protein